MNLKRGFSRVTLVLSVVATVAFITMGLVWEGEIYFWVAAIAFCCVWLVHFFVYYVLVKYVLGGFLDE
jgi:hypothetical protein